MNEAFELAADAMATFADAVFDMDLSEPDDEIDQCAACSEAAKE